MNISDTFYVALCMTILIIGVVYWFWTQNQYIQRKLNLLENIVYEMKTSLNTPESLSDPGPEPVGLEKVEYPPAPSSELGDDDDLLHEQLHSEQQPEQFIRREQIQEQEQEQERMLEQYQEQGQGQEKEKKEQEQEQGHEQQAEITEFSQFDSLQADDLQPGGIGSGLAVEVPADSTGSSLDSMTLKELKRLAEQRKIQGASNMRKQALIDALRSGITKDSGSQIEVDL